MIQGVQVLIYRNTSGVTSQIRNKDSKILFFEPFATVIKVEKDVNKGEISLKYSLNL